MDSLTLRFDPAYPRYSAELAINGENVLESFGAHWLQGSTWTETPGSDVRIGLVAMGGAGFTAAFDYVRVYALPP